MKAVDIIALILLIVGGLNWLLIGLVDFNLVATLFGDMTMLSRIVYILVGLSALWCLRYFRFLMRDDRDTRTTR